MPMGFGSGYAGAIQTPFAYVTVPQVRAAGIPDETADPEFGVDDARLRSLIIEMSQWVNRLTDQWFWPIRLQEQVDGNKGSVITIPNMIPILELFDLRLQRENLVNFSYPKFAFQVKERYVMMVTRRVKIPDYPYFVVLDGVFGWLQHDFSKFKTTTVAVVNPAGGTVAVADASKCKVGDTVVVGARPEPYAMTFIVTAVDTTGPFHTISYDPDLAFNCPEIPAGAPVVKYGQVPLQIQRAVLLMIRDRTQKVGDIDIFESPFGKGTRLQSESVEGYSYSMAAMPAVNG
ncbi:MAG TPA: hypothetical protein VM285_13105, partial [Polyangia bacterium]|nr:hypothetical protein [Polyangia bacterium]